MLLNLSLLTVKCYLIEYWIPPYFSLLFWCRLDFVLSSISRYLVPGCSSSSVSLLFSLVVVFRNGGWFSTFYGVFHSPDLLHGTIKSFAGCKVPVSRSAIDVTFCGPLPCVHFWRVTIFMILGVLVPFPLNYKLTATFMLGVETSFLCTGQFLWVTTVEWVSSTTFIESFLKICSLQFFFLVFCSNNAVRYN